MADDEDHNYGRGRAILTPREREVLKAGPGGYLPDGKMVTYDYHNIAMKRAEGRLKKLADDIRAMDESRSNLGDLARREVHAPLDSPILIPDNWNDEGGEYVHKETRKSLRPRVYEKKKAERDVLDAYLNESVFSSAVEFK